MPSDQTQNEIMIRPTLTHSRSDRLPLTSVNNYYQEAKRLEYDERNLDKAIQFYELAIKNHEKVDSAIKDLAAALHQRGNTCEAVEFLLKHRSFYKGDLEKYDNLTMNLKKQIHAPSGKNLNKHLLVIVDKPDRDGIFKLFANNSRIVSVKFYTDLSFSEEFDENCNKQQCYCLISFLSYSAAKKTFDSLRTTKPPCIYWVNINKLVVCQATCQDSLQINSHYHGFSRFGFQVTVQDDRDLIPSEKFKEIESIWKKDDEMVVSQSDELSRRRLHLENETKILMIRDKKLRLISS